MNNTYLEHHGIKGMRWGIRRYQNKDGSLTPAGRRRLSQLDAEREALAGTKSENKPKTFREMSTDELRDQINRRRMEKEYLELNKQVSDLAPAEVSTGQKIVSHLSAKVIVPAITDAGKKFLTDFLNKQGSKLLGVSNIEKPLKDVVADMNLKKQKIELDNYFEEYNKKQKASKQKSTKASSDDSKKTPNESQKSQSTESKKTPQNESPKTESSKKSEKTETFTGKVYGEGTSHETFTRNEEKRKNSGTVYTYDFTDRATSDSEVRAVVNVGQQYVAGLLEEKKK